MYPNSVIYSRAFIQYNTKISIDNQIIVLQVSNERCYTFE